jgi:hypothetical protein
MPGLGGLKDRSMKGGAYASLLSKWNVDVGLEMLLEVEPSARWIDNVQTVS